MPSTIATARSAPRCVVPACGPARPCSRARPFQLPELPRRRSAQEQEHPRPSLHDGGPSGDGRRDEGSDYGSVTESPIEEFLDAVDRLELDAIMALMAPDVRVLVVCGRRAEGTDAVRQLFADSSASFARPRTGSRPSGTRTTSGSRR
jgi:hypothetical protein